MIITLYIILLTFIIIYDIVRKPYVPFDYLRLFHIFFCLEYIITPIVLLIYPDEEWRFAIFAPEGKYSLAVFGVILLGYVGVFLGMKYSKPNKVKGSILILKWRLNEKKFLFIVTMLLLFVIMNLFIYSLSFGGLVNLAISGYLIRRGTLIDESGIFVYFKFFAEGLPWITLLLTSFCINFSSGNMKKSRGFSNTVLTAYILITISLIFSLIFALGTGGRGNLIVTILPCVYLLINKYRRFFSVKQIILVTVTLLLAYWVTIYARPYMYALGSTAINKGSFALNDITALAQGYIEKASGENVESDFKTSIVGFFSNLDHTVTATYLVMSNPEHFNFPRIFLDYFRALISLIPGIHYSTFDLFHVTKNPSMLVNDFLGFGSLVPPGWIANAYVNGWYPLVFLWGFIAGYIGGKIEYTIRINIAIAPWMEGIYIFMYFYWNLIFFHGESTKLVLSNIPFVIIIFTLLQWLTISKRHYKIFKTGNRKVIIA